MKFNINAIAAAVLAVGVSVCQAQATFATIGTSTSISNSVPADLNIVLNNDRGDGGSQALGGTPLNVVLSGAKLPAPFTDVSCIFFGALGPPDLSTGSPRTRCDFSTEIATISTLEGSESSFNFQRGNQPFCVFCVLAPTQPLGRRDVKRDL